MLSPFLGEMESERGIFLDDFLDFLLSTPSSELVDDVL
jgi:hypothetical protein